MRGVGEEEEGTHGFSVITLQTAAIVHMTSVVFSRGMSGF